MKTLFSILFEAFVVPFAMMAILIDESRRINEDGSWDGYWARKNRKAKGGER